MEDNVIIKQREYKKFNSSIIEGLQDFLINPDIKLDVTRTGVTIDDDEMITISSNYVTYVTYRVDKDFIVKNVTVSKDTFSGPTAIFRMKDQERLVKFFFSFIGQPIILKE